VVLDPCPIANTRPTPTRPNSRVESRRRRRCVLGFMRIRQRKCGLLADRNFTIPHTAVEADAATGCKYLAAAVAIVMSCDGVRPSCDSCNQDGRTDGQTDRRTDGRTAKFTSVWTRRGADDADAIASHAPEKSLLIATESE